MNMMSNNILELRNVCVSYSPGKYAVDNVSFSLERNTVTSIVGPRESGKSSLLRAINRMHELYPNIKTKGEILLNGKNIREIDVRKIRRKIGMIFSQPNIFPNMSIKNNILAGYRLNGIRLSKSKEDWVVEDILQRFGLWDDFKNLLDKKNVYLPEIHKQYLCMCRTLALNPELILMDAPLSSIKANLSIEKEELLADLKRNHTFLIIANRIPEAARISDYSIYMEDGKLIEYAPTRSLFTNPQEKQTIKYITGIYE